MTPGLGRWPGLALWLWAVTAGCPLAAEVELYRPEHRLASELAGLAGGILGEAGAVVADPGTGTLVLRGSREAIEATLRVLRRLDVPLRSYRVESRAISMLDLRRRGLLPEAWIEAGDLCIGRWEVRESGLRLSAVATRALASSEQGASLMVREGTSADLWTGRSYPTPVVVLEERGQETRIFTTPSPVPPASLVPVGSGFRVRPRHLADDTVALEVQRIVSREGPEVSAAVLGAAMQVRLRTGEWVAIATREALHQRQRTSPSGGLEQAAAGAARTLLLRVLPSDSGAQ